MSTFADSQKEDKRIANRIFRHRAKQAIHSGYEPPYRLREVSDVYGFAGDGKTYWGFDYEKNRPLNAKMSNTMEASL